PDDAGSSHLAQGIAGCDPSPLVGGRALGVVIPIVLYVPRARATFPSPTLPSPVCQIDGLEPVDPPGWPSLPARELPCHTARMPQPRRVKAADVAREAEVSTATVSYVLNKTPGQKVSAATAERVREAARRLGYVGNGAGQTLARATPHFAHLATSGSV